MSNDVGAEKSLEKKLEEAMEQLKAKDEDLKKKDDELKMKDEELHKEREEWREKERELKKERNDGKEKERKLQMKDMQLQKTKKELSKEREERLAKKRELEKLRRQTPGKIGFVGEGSKKWEMEVEKICETFAYSDCTSIGSVPFRIGCRTELASGTKNLAIYLFCNDKAPPKTFSATVDFTLALASSVTSRSLLNIFTFTPSALKRGWTAFRAWADFIDPAKGYVQNGRITIEAQIKVIWYDKNADFFSHDPQLTDVILVVGGKEFHVCKKHVAIYSQFFKTIFLSDFAEKGKELVELPEVDSKEFEDLLRMIHPQRRTTVTKDNVEYLLRLADYFMVDVVRWQCIDFLKESTDFLPAAKLQLAEKYHLVELQNKILSKMNTRETAKGVIDSDEFKNYSDPLKNYVLQKKNTL